jgi:hypothetical protein
MYCRICFREHDEWEVAKGHYLHFLRKSCQLTGSRIYL